MFIARQEAIIKKKRFGTEPGSRLANADAELNYKKHDCRNHSQPCRKHAYLIRSRGTLGSKLHSIKSYQVPASKSFDRNS